MRIPIHALLPFALICAVVWCIKWDLQEAKRRREERAEIARELRDNDARERVAARWTTTIDNYRTDCARQVAALGKAPEKAACHHQIEPCEFDVSHAHGTLAERVAAAMWN